MEKKKHDGANKCKFIKLLQLLASIARRKNKGTKKLPSQLQQKHEVPNRKRQHIPTNLNPKDFSNEPMNSGNEIKKRRFETVNLFGPFDKSAQIWRV